jgi:hypothetical protein
VALTVLSGTLIGSSPDRADASVVKYAQDDRGTGWYPDQTGLSPAAVSSGNFGRVWDAKVNGSVYAQPVLSNGIAFVATIANWIYGIDTSTGAIKWSRFLGQTWDSRDLNCLDLQPGLGTVGTPVIDQATNSAYFFSKTYASGTTGAGAYFAHGVVLATGAELPGFPASIQGTASNDPQTSFNPTTQLQLPGLILLDGVVYAAFGGICDHPIYQGWIVGVSTAGRITTMWTDEAHQSGNPGGGIWQSGGGIISDGPGQLLFAVGNGNIPASPTAGASPPDALGESMVRLTVQKDKSLKATDFFMPYDASALNDADADLGSGAPILLPTEQFGTSSTPHLALLAGKQGYLYVMNSDDLGGYQQGANGSDRVINRLGPVGGLWSKPAVWPGDGGYVYLVPAQRPMIAMKYGTDGNGRPTFSKVGETADSFGFRSGSPVVSSIGTTPGSALVWTIWNGDVLGTNAQLRAYDPVPVNGTLRLRWSTPVGTSAKFTSPIIDGNRVILGTGDGHVQMYSYPTDALFDPASVSFPRTTTTTTSDTSVTLRARQDVTVTAIASSTSQVTVGRGSPTLPAHLHSGDILTIPVSFTPSDPRIYAESLTLTTNSVPVTIGISGIGQYASARLESAPDSRTVSFGGVSLGSSPVTATVTLRNTGAENAIITAVSLPGAPFEVSGTPAVGSVLAPGGQVTATATLRTNVLGLQSDALVVASTGGTATIALSGIIGPPPRLDLSSTLLTPSQSIEVGRTARLSVTLSNSGGTALVITRSKPPSSSGFAVVDSVPEGKTLQPGESTVASVDITPTFGGDHSDFWEFNGPDNGGIRRVTFQATATLSPLPAAITEPGWTRNGTATRSGSEFILTDAKTPNAAGTSFWTHPVLMPNLRVTFDMFMGSTAPSGGAGLAFVYGDVGRTDLSGVGRPGGNLGFSGLGSDGICFRTFKRTFPDPAQNDPSDNFVASCAARWNLATLGSRNIALPLRNKIRHVELTFSASSKVTVKVDDTVVLSMQINLPRFATVGFAAANGAGTQRDLHTVSNVKFSRLIPKPSEAGWVLNGGATARSGGFELTALSSETRGSAFLEAPLTPNLTAEFDLDLRGKSAGAGTTFALVDAAKGQPTALGGAGAGLGWTGTPGVAVAFDTVKDANDPSNNFVGISTTGSSGPTWLTTTSSIPNLTNAVRKIRITVTSSRISVAIDGVTVLSAAVTVPAAFYPGFTAAKGSLGGNHPINQPVLSQN